MTKSAAFRVIILDTNAFGGGYCAPSDVALVENLVQTGARVVVPDVVVHELAAHIRQDVENVRLGALALAVSDDAARDIDTWNRRDRFYDGVARTLSEAGCEISATPQRWWQPAVIDQIYSTSPATRRQNVTTGAVDAIVAHHALEANERFGASLVVTNDGPLKQHLSSKDIRWESSLQEAIGLVADNASADIVRKLVVAMFKSPAWLDAFAASLVGELNPEEIATLDILGVSNVTTRGSNLHATIVFTADQLRETATLYGRTAEYGGNHLHTSETELDGTTFAPLKTFSTQLNSESFDYAWVPWPVSPENYIEIERSCLPVPQAGGNFTTTHADDGISRVSQVEATLGGQTYAEVELRSVDYEYASGPVGHIQQSGSVTILSELASVSARRPITTAGYLGTRLLRRWAGAE